MLERSSRWTLRKLQRRHRPLELLSPIRKLLEHIATRLPVPLPVRKVCILRRSFQSQHLSGGEGLIESGKLVREHTERPAVADDLMHGDQQEVFLLAYAQQPAPNQRARGEIEAMRHFLLQDLL